MNALQRFTDQRGILILLTAAWSLMGVLLGIVTPLTLPLLLPLTLLAPLVWCWASARPMPRLERSPLVVPFVLAACYLLINASWSLSPSSAYLTVVLLFVFIAALHVTLSVLEGSEALALRTMSLGFVLGFALGGAVLCLEVFSQQWVHRQLTTYIPWFRPADRHLFMVGDQVVYLPPYLLNRSITMLALLFFPALHMVRRLELTGRTRACLYFGLFLAATAILRSQHGTSKVALVGAAIIYALTWYAPLLTKRVIGVWWIAAALFVVPITSLGYTLELHKAAWLPHSAKHRIVIWYFTGERIEDAPLLGVGINTARALNDPSDLEVPRVADTDFKASVSVHAHNGYLQTWYEAGAVGAVLLLSIGLLLLQSLGRSPLQTQPYLFAAFTACALVGASSFSLWQPWFMAAFGFVAVWATLARELDLRGADPAAS